MPFAVETVDGPQLGLRGLTLAIDFGLLMARDLMTHYSSLYWRICRAKRSRSFNLPVLTGFPKHRGLQFDPYLIGRNCISRMFDEGRPDRGIEVFEYWLDLPTPK
jgi:hypothetical protein